MNHTIATLNELGLSKVCRACLSDEGEMKSVFIGSSDNPNILIFRMFECCTAVEISETDGLPGLICSQCELRLTLAYYFRELCQRSNTTLRTYIENATRYSVKKETPPEENFILENFKEENVCEERDQSDEEKCDIPENNEIDSDDQPLLERQEKTTKARFTIEIVNQAIDATKKRFHEKRECKICGFISTNARGLSLHIAHLHKEIKDKWCSTCGEQFEDLNNHMKEKHFKVRSFACTFCEKTFLSPGHLTEHIRSHSTDRPYKCQQCGKGFLSGRHLKVHARIHSGEKPYSCPHCNRKFSQKGSLQGHIRTHTGFKPYRCETCKKRCTTASALAIHRSKTGHKTFTKIVDKNLDEKIQDEPTSNKESTDENNVTTTIKTEDPLHITPILPDSTASTSIDKDVTRKLCTVCGKTFSTTSKLRLHMRVHTGETPYKCQQCPKQFTTRGQLVVHIRTHTGERPHVCHVCGKGFAQSSVLSTHMKLHTGRPEQCNICQQRFCRPAELRLHMRKHTGEKPFLCADCGHSFIQRSHLMEHIKIHSDERPYKCTICDRGFKQSSSLKSHVQIHTGYKPYTCSQCPYACRQPYSLTQHMKQHIADQPIADKPHICLVCHKSFTTLAMLTSHSRSVHQTII